MSFISPALRRAMLSDSQSHTDLTGLACIPRAEPQQTKTANSVAPWQKLPCWDGKHPSRCHT
eukprot:2511042-Karenia_brevis.AAC.1